MCGIVGGVAKRDVKAILLEGLRRLEYRGYDSAGIALAEGNYFFRERVKGKVKDLADKLQSNANIKGTIGIAHTRWATHGAPNINNAHPHISIDEIAIVHNGIIENHNELKETLIADGYKFDSDTDTEVIAHLIHSTFKKEKNLLSAVQKAVKKLIGAFAIGVIAKQFPNEAIAVRKGSPLVIGIGFEENFFASDLLALMPVTQKFIHLMDGDIARLTTEKVEIFDLNDQKVTRNIELVNNSVLDNSDKGQYRHFMQKEIFEQPDALRATLQDRIQLDDICEEILGLGENPFLNKAKAIHIVACGTSYHAGMVAKYWLEQLAKIPCSVEVASEYRYRFPVVPNDTIFISISQSGETADTLSALRMAKSLGYIGIISICNVAESAMVRESDFVLLTKAGREIGVASTKAFTTQLCVLLITSLLLARKTQSALEQTQEIITALKLLPSKVEEILQLDKKIASVAEIFTDKQHALYLGRGIHFPIALEGALKLKEISYIHAEAYPAGELKHGPLALVDKNMPAVVLAPNDHLLEKMQSNMHEVKARGGQLVVFSSGENCSCKTFDPSLHIEMPVIPKWISPIIYNIPLQLLAYHVAVNKGTDVDQPRNLAKSVTVE